jgi:hypothetical protein
MEKKSPRDLRRLENRSSRCALSLSGSGAPSNLRVAAAVTGRAPGGFGSPEGVPIALPLAGSPCGAPAAAGLPCGPPEDVPPGAGPASSLRRRPGPEGSVSGLSAFVGSPGFRVWPCGLRRFPRFGSPPCGGSANLARSPRVECFDCLERGELYGPRQRRSTPRFRRSDYESAGSGLAKKSDNSQRTVAPVTAVGEPAGQRPSSALSRMPETPEAASTSSYTETIWSVVASHVKRSA